MLSFNFDYIFDAFYRFLLWIRYFLIFKVLHISPQTYLNDHRYDTWDGLRDLGYLNQTGSTQGGNTFPNLDVHQAIQQTNAEPWFHNLKFSIQNPILAFLADVLIMLSVFVLVILIYSFVQWYRLSIKPAKEVEEKKKEEENAELEVEQAPKIKADFQELEMEQEEFEEEKEGSHLTSVAEDLLEAMPAGIPGLPIDTSEITEAEVGEIETKEDLLMTYKVKNIFEKEENQILKVKKSLEQEDKKISREKETEIIEKAETKYQAKIYVAEEKHFAFKQRWDIVLGYLEGQEEALWRIGILEADNLFNDLLEDKGYVGTTLADKLTQTNLRTSDLAWSAHKMRNRIAHEGSKFVLTERMARKTLEDYRAVFEELKLFE